MFPIWFNILNKWGFVLRKYLGFVGIILMACFLSGCADRSNLKVFVNSDPIKYKLTGFRASQQVGGRLLLRPVTDRRFDYLGKVIGGKEAKINDDAMGRNMCKEFEYILVRELRKSGIFNDVLLTEEASTPSDSVMTVKLEVLFSEVRGFFVGMSGSVVQFNADLKRNGKIILDQQFLEVGTESERTAESGLASTVADALDDVAAIAIRKSMKNLLQKMESQF